MVVGTCSMALGMVAMPVSGLPLELFRVDILSRKDDIQKEKKLHKRNLTALEK
jgi:hypothetical protein